MQKRVGLFLLFTLMFLAACSNQEKAQEAKEEKEPSVESEQKTYTYPLTGEVSNEPVDNRIVAVMVNNHSKARPQTGLTDADVVYEILAEGNITRFLALFQSELPNVIGPVRSAREYYYTLAQGFNALYVYHGAAKPIQQEIEQLGIDYLNGKEYDNNGTLFKRENFREAPHNSYLQFHGVYDTAQANDLQVIFEHRALPFLDDEQVNQLNGESASHVEIAYAESEVVEYQYDEAKHHYTRYNDGEQTVDYHTDEPVTVQNVFIVEAAHHVIDEQGRRSIDLQVGGNGYLIQHGQMEQVQWQNDNGHIIPYKDGEQLRFVPGKTWVNVVPEQPGIQQSVTISAQ
ncbi:DUF3048 domain-containing protein [Pontibacillus litoralis]|uniref:Lipoprotein YerB n=1 Tax=Pontibacillus litoralis JSM 072002 TaxID=1385512 RepID=A0A0A5GAL2_9BACI|nr:DUF3048 domain-containing protein [Pontibacillus litoralis]KGX88238.1 hypothetical protein N784_10995 [Pontibacillus litoralis JSM 072002]